MPELSLAKRSSSRSRKIRLEISADQIEAVKQLVGHTVAEVECELIIETLANQRGSDITEAAKLLGISIRTLRNKIHEYDGRGKSVPKPGVHYSALSLTVVEHCSAQRSEECPPYSQKQTCAAHKPMSASLIGQFGSSAFRLSTVTLSMSLAGSRFSSESAPGPFHYGIRRRGGTILSDGLAARVTVGPSGHANSPHPSSREGHHSTARWSSCSSYRL